MKPNHRLISLICYILPAIATSINRQSVVSRYNPTRNASSLTTPMQVGNGNFAFGADVTGLQTFQPFAILSSWGWKNDSLPPGKSTEDVENFRGVSWLNHGRPVQYDFGGNDPSIEQWLIANPNRVNLGRVGIVFRSPEGVVVNVTEKELTNIHQKLDLWTGVITSQFSWENTPITVETAVGQESDTVAIKLTSPLLQMGRLGLFLDFPWNDGLKKFSAPFVGNWEAEANHTTSLRENPKPGVWGEIGHQMVDATFFTAVSGDRVSIHRNSPVVHRYTLLPSTPSQVFSATLAYGRTTQSVDALIRSPDAIFQESTETWSAYWEGSGFVDVFTGSTDPRADELQRRIILSRYLMRVNEAGDTPPQEVC